MNATALTASPQPADNVGLRLDTVRARLAKLSLHGLLSEVERFMHEPWLANLLEIEERERERRSLKKRLDDAKLRAFKPLADFDWSWPTQCDRSHIEEIFTLRFIEEHSNIVLIGPNGLGKTMIAKNLLHQAVLRGYSARFTRAAEMLADLAKQDSSSALRRRIRHYAVPALLGVDEVGYMSYDTRYADLFFEVVNQRYQEGRPLILSTNKVFGDWSEVFPNAACVVTLVDRLVHRCELIELDGKSYRLKEAEERAARKAAERAARKLQRAAQDAQPD